MSDRAKAWVLSVAVLGVLALLGVVLPEYYQTNLARILVLATFAMGYNLLFGYTGLLSLGHALFFAAGLFAMGLTMRWAGLEALPAFLLGVIAGGLVAALVGALALRTEGVAFMIVTLMLAQAGFLTVLYFSAWTNGDEGFVIQAAERQVAGIDLTQRGPRFAVALGIFALGLLAKLWLIQSATGRALVAIRENAPRAEMLGYNVFRLRLLAVGLSGVYAGAAGALYGLLFGYVGATFASVQYSIFALLYVLLGGAGTLLGPLLGTSLMFLLVDTASGLTDAYLFLVGVALVLLTLFAPLGLLGELRRRVLRWLP